MEVVASLSQGRTAAAQCGFFTHKSVPVIFQPPCTFPLLFVVNKSDEFLINSEIQDINIRHISNLRMPSEKFRCLSKGRLLFGYQDC